MVTVFESYHVENRSHIIISYIFNRDYCSYIFGYFILIISLEHWPTFPFSISFKVMTFSISNHLAIVKNLLLCKNPCSLSFICGYPRGWKTLYKPQTRLSILVHRVSPTVAKIKYPCAKELICSWFWFSPPVSVNGSGRTAQREWHPTSKRHAVDRAAAD